MDEDRIPQKPVLQSTEELKGKSSGAKRGGARGKWATLLALLVLSAGAWGLYAYTDVFKGADDPAATTAPSVATKLIDKNPADFDRATVALKGAEPYTLISNLQYNDDGTTREMPEGEREYSIGGMDFFAVNASAGRALENYASSLSAADTVVRAPEDFSIYGLDDPAVVVDVSFRDGSRHKVELGAQAPASSAYYARVDGGDTVYTVSSGVETAFGRSLNEMHALAMPEANVVAETFGALMIEQAGAETVEIRQANVENSASIVSLKLTRPIQHDANAERTTALIQAVAGVTLSAYEAHAETPEQLAAYGLDAPRARVRFTDAEGKTLDFSVGAAKDETYCYLSIDRTGDVYLTRNDLVAFLADATLANLVDQFAGLVNILRVDALRVDIGNERYLLTIQRTPVVKEDGTEGFDAAYAVDGKATEEAAFKALYQDVIGLLFDKMKDSAQPSGDPVAKLTYQLNNGESDIVVEYLTYDRDFYAVRQNGRELFLIKRTKVDAMIEKCAQFRAGTYTVD